MSTTEPVTYLRDKGFKISRVRRTETPKSGTHSGYGARLPTSRQVQLEGTVPGAAHFGRSINRWYRVYVIQYSNAGSAYILKNKQRMFFSDCDLPDED